MGTKKATAETPLMKQYRDIKGRYPDALLLFRIGDFYETFGEDARKASGILGIILTKRANGAASYVDLAGFPHHSLDTYLPRLIKAGQRVAICEQLEDPKMAKTIVKRGVTEMITPGVSYNDNVLNKKENNFLAGLHLGVKTSGISFLDISTGEFYVTEGNNEYIDKLLQTFKPNEVIVQKNKLNKFLEAFGNKFYTKTFDDWVFTSDFAYDLLTEHFGTVSLKGFGIEEFNNAIVAAGSALHYLAETQHEKLKHINTISRIEEDRYVWLDRFTIKNLELISPINENARTLLDILDRTHTPMGGRLMKRWIVLPLKEKGPIEERLDVVDYLVKDAALESDLTAQLKLIGDLERIISKVAIGKINPKEVVQLRRAMHSIEKIRKRCRDTNSQGLQRIGEQLNFCPGMREMIEKEIQDDPPVAPSKGNVIRSGVNGSLDELRELVFSGKDYLERIQKREVERTGISSLKIGYNNVFGYYLEVTNTHKDKVPSDWHRKQTLVNSERYITEELKEYEQKILGAEEKILELEVRLYQRVVERIVEYIPPIQLNASLLARLDCLLSFTAVSKNNRYNRPAINESDTLEILRGRHPVIEQELPLGEDYIPNDVYLDSKKQQIMIITGPNMSGKSALLRQSALIVLLAQMGCFVPAQKASIGIIDKLFTRVGASDNISSGESTFMVEMNEAASILNNLSDRSLIILDEIGRGTSTYDGISIAWAITEFLHEHPLFKSRVLFATHYHELNEMASSFPRIKNFHVTVREIKNEVVFLRKLARGGSEHSFGIHVARMAGMPQTVIGRANEILKQLEKTHSHEQFSGTSGNKKQTADKFQLSFIQLDDPLLQQIKDDILNTDIDTLTPVEALMKLNEIKRLLGTQKK